MSEKTPDPYHEDQSLFRKALLFTEAQKGFGARLIEKDYYCSLLLRDFSTLFEQHLVFKGGTCLSKVHIEFFRMSEDLDFAISINPDATRSKRRKAIEPVQIHLSQISDRMPVFVMSSAFVEHKNNSQYVTEFAYRSVISLEQEKIKVEISLREKVLQEHIIQPAMTLLMNPPDGLPVLMPFPVRALSITEACAEKIRAALTRKQPAIRDFFDIHALLQQSFLDHRSPEFQDLVSRKLAITPDAIDLSPPRIAQLRSQIETDLQPVLRPEDYQRFAIDPVLDLLQEVISRYTNGR